MLKLQILGIGCRRSKALKDNVLEALKRYPLNVTLEEITEVDELMKFDISSTPALLINGQVVAEDAVLSVEEIRELLERCGAKEQSNLRLKHILVPTDFSESSKGAFVYAQALAAEVDASIKVVHMYHPEFDVGNPFMDEPLTAFEQNKRETLTEFIRDNTIHSGESVATATRIEKEVVIGFAAEEIVRLTKTGKFDLVVMGTTGEAGFLGRVLGQVSTQVAQQSVSPVLFVPRGVTHRLFKNVLYAAKYQPGDEAVMRWITKWTVFFSANLHLVHVLESKENGFQLEQVDMERHFHRNGQTVQVASIKSESVIDGLNQYARENKIDLVVLTALQRRFYERFFHRSVTKRLLINSKLPLLVVPSKF
ncbi:MAG: universal stress protein [Lewinellaceae bacterium]|nr:universal stress protein [Lewinellaceae bacterium]